MPGLFQVSVKGVYVRDSQALLLEGDGRDGTRYWDLPGGRLEQGESPQAGLRREIAEELPSLRNLEIGQLLFTELSWHLDDKCDLIVCYYQLSGSLTAVTLTDEHTGYRWVTRTSAETLVTETGQTFFDRGMDTALLAALA